MDSEPLLTANIYCARQLDAVIGHAIVPFWRQLSSDRSSYLWLIRHARAGEHLKVRLHGPPELRDRARQLLEREVTTCFANLPEGPVPEIEPSQISLPVIDPEDAVDTSYPDRTLLWTTYQASPVTFGARILADDPRFQGLFTRVLGAGCRIALDLFAATATQGGAPLPVAKRQRSIFKLCVLTWQALPLDAAIRSRYLAYHRDWLVRWTLANSDPGTTTRESVLELFDRKVGAMQGPIGVLASLLRQRPEEDTKTVTDEAQMAYRRTVREYFDYLATFRGNPDYDLDPYTDDPVFLPIFKVLHNLANSIGLGIRHEAFTYHLLTIAADREQT